MPGMQRFFQIVGLLACLLGEDISARGQSVISTNILFPYRFVSETWKPGLDIGLTFNHDSNSDFKASLYLNQAFISRLEMGGPISGSIYRTDFYLDKAGVRLQYKQYTRKVQKSPVKTGFFIGVFADGMYVQAHLKTWINDVKQPDTVDGRGILIGGGPEIGATWKIGRITIEPALGIGFCGTSRSIYRERDPNFLLDPAPLENVVIKLTPSHLDLTLGYVLGRR
jgi:hypothetical protein